MNKTPTTKELEAAGSHLGTHVNGAHDRLEAGDGLPEEVDLDETLAGVRRARETPDAHLGALTEGRERALRLRTEAGGVMDEAAAISLQAKRAREAVGRAIGQVRAVLAADEAVHRVASLYDILKYNGAGQPDRHSVSEAMDSAESARQSAARSLALVWTHVEREMQEAERFVAAAGSMREAAEAELVSAQDMVRRLLLDGLSPGPPSHPRESPRPVLMWTRPQRSPPIPVRRLRARMTPGTKI